jgi:acetyl/propionyl-CoA carboxylase alpha subunit
MPIAKILIANRGEIAVRIIRAARELGILAEQIYSQAGRAMLAARLADEAGSIACRIGFPVMIKAVAGGGGPGIRIAETEGELARRLPEASAEARAAFGDAGLYLERFIPQARHVEAQVLGDGSGVIHLYERECSLQRRRQKLWGKAPAPSLDAATRAALCAFAVRLARSVGYRGAGTMEYLYDDATGEFSFIEMNTCIQVEHPLTEMITGVELVREMIRIAGGEALRLDQDDIARRGHAIKCRVNAEDPARQRARAGLGTARAGRTARALRHHALSWLGRAAFLRLAARQADHLRPDARGGAVPPAPGARRGGDRRHQDHAAGARRARQRCRRRGGALLHALAGELARSPTGRRGLTR